RLFPNRFVFSREGGKQNAPYLTVDVGGEDREPPAAPLNLRTSVQDLPAGEAIVSWRCPNDAGSAGIAGFFVSAEGKPIPQYLVPKPSAPGEVVSMRLRDLGLEPGKRVELTVRAVDGAG